MSAFVSAASWQEDISSLLPAVSLLTQLGYIYLNPDEALELRNNKRNRVVLEEVLREQLRRINNFEVKGQSYDFSDKNIDNAVTALSQHPYNAIHTTSLALYELITLGKAYEETVDGTKRSHQLKYIDFANPSNNVFHVSDEFTVDRRGVSSTRRPDIVLFCNGIPLVVIECKRPDLKGKDPMDQAISQLLKYHDEDNIPQLFCLAQLLIAVSESQAKYATTATSASFWSVWQEEDVEQQERELSKLINTPLSNEVKNSILAPRKDWQKAEMNKQWNRDSRLVTEQDKTLYSLTRPERLLDLIKTFIVFDAKIKKIARYQQYFAVKATVDWVQNTNVTGEKRNGGVIWHTTGSGKSLTMFMMAKALAKDAGILSPKVILVTDRVDLDVQIRDTFKGCFHGDADPVMQAKSGRHLAELVASGKGEIITTIIDKFEMAAKEKISDDSKDIFILVDESHRSQYGTANALMRNVFPNACYLGFTGTPLLKKDKSTADKFGGFIHKYTMRQAVRDGAVRPLFYEGRDSEFRNTEKVDRWFEEITEDLNDKEKADLKRKFKSAEPIYNATERMAEIALDISKHFKFFRGDSSLKGQFAVSSKANAIAYRKLLRDFEISAEVIVSPPDEREGSTEVNQIDSDTVQDFWKKMMATHGSPKKYQDSLIEQFKGEGEPHMLIVVDKLLTGFDAPRNTVLYIDKRLKEHSILQAIARVNRVFEGKEYGLVVDYRGIFGEMNEALDMYDALEAEGFEREDVEDTLTSTQEEIDKLAERHTHVWDVFKTVEDTSDRTAMQLHLRPEDVREDYYDTLKSFTKTLQLALANANWHRTTSEKDKKRYNNDLKIFLNLRSSVRKIYGEAVDYSDYDARIRAMVAKYIGADEVQQIIKRTSVFAVDEFAKEIDEFEGDAAKAEAMAARMKKAITERMDEDPAFYKKLSEMIQSAIDAHMQKRIDDAELLKQQTEVLELMQTKGVNLVPEKVRDSDEARAYYGLFKEGLTDTFDTQEDLTDHYADLAAKVKEIIGQHKVRDWSRKDDIKKRMQMDIDDLFYDFQKSTGLKVDFKKIDNIMNQLFITAGRYD